MTARIPYRPDVDGLRAVAVLAVVLFHIGVPALPGGFVGVDCFFAISGFLIFSLLYQEQRVAGSIDWLSFFARRATRLLPEACALIAVVMAVGYFVLAPIAPDVPDGRGLAQHALAESGMAAALWCANIYYSVVGMGYFQPSVGREPLVHLWSLGVEEQFYLAVPLMFLLAGLFSRLAGRVWAQAAAWLLALTFITSLVIAVWWSTAHPWSAYYMLPTRAYEFAVGAAAALWSARPNFIRPSPRTAAVLATAGMAAIVASVIGFRADMAFPGAWALIPTIGTTLVVLGCGPGTLGMLRSFLTYPAITYIGKISYGWYLWHWPMLVFWREYWLFEVSLASQIAVAVAAVIPAAIGYHAVARLRRSSTTSRSGSGRILGLGAAGIAATLAACGVLAWSAHAGTTTPNAEVLNARLKDRWRTPSECVAPVLDEPLSDCPFGDPDGDLTLVLWGDSHALHWLPALDPLLKEQRIRGILRTFAGCPAGLSVSRGSSDPFAQCVAFTAAAIANVVERSRREPVVVLLASRWTIYVNNRPYSFIERSSTPEDWAPGGAVVEFSLAKLVAELTSEGIPVGLVQQVPEQRYEVPVCLYRMAAERCSAPWNEEIEYLRPAREIVSRIAGRHGAAILDPLPLLCDAGSCPVTRGALVLYIDEDHLSGGGARSLSAPLRDVVVTLVAARRSSGAATLPLTR